MRIYAGWTIKSKCQDSDHLDGATIEGAAPKIRGTQRYFLKLKSGVRKTVKRDVLLSWYNSGAIDFVTA